MEVERGSRTIDLSNAHATYPSSQPVSVTGQLAWIAWAAVRSGIPCTLSHVRLWLRDSLFDLNRLSAFLWACLRYGFPEVVSRLSRRPGRVSMGARLRFAMEYLGVTYIKLGQYLALRIDLLPPAVTAELDKLFDRAPELDFESVRRQVETELGGPLKQFFREFCPKPIGAASIAQVHRAVALNGEQLAVKVQRPNVSRVFAADMRNLMRAARLVDRLGALKRISLHVLVREFSDFTKREMDFCGEAQTACSLGQEMVAGVRAPRVRWDLTTPRLLTMEYIDGVSVLRLCELSAAGENEEVRVLLKGNNLRTIMSSVVEAALYQIFVTGRFHGDPHFANILISTDGMPVFIDWGIHGELPATQRDLLRDYIESWVLGDLHRAAYCWTRMSELTEDTDIRQYTKDLVGVLAGWNAVSRNPSATVEERHIARWQGEVVKVMRRHSVRLPPEQLLVWRAITVLEASSMKLPYRSELVPELADFFFRHRRAPEVDLVDATLQTGFIADIAPLLHDQARWLSRLAKPGENKSFIVRRHAGKARNRRGGSWRFVVAASWAALTALVVVSTAPAHLVESTAAAGLSALTLVFLAMQR